MPFRTFGAACFAVLWLAGAAAAQEGGDFSDFLGAEEEAQAAREQLDADLGKFAAVLNGPDPARAQRAMEFMLDSGKPDYVKYASEFGLFSNSSELQNAAIRTILDNGGPFRMVVDLDGSHASQGRALADYYKMELNADKTEAYHIFSVQRASESETCWIFKGDARFCAFIMVGGNLSLREWSNLKGNLTLNDAGELVGVVDFRENVSQMIPVRIPLIYLPS